MNLRQQLAVHTRALPRKTLFLCAILGCYFAGPVAAQSFLVAEQALPATTGNTFTQVTFPVPFPAGTTPNVFPMTTEDGDDPCNIRINSVTNTGFNAVCYEPANEDGDHPGLMLEYIAVLDGTTTVPVSGGGSVAFQSQCVSTDTQFYQNQCNGCSGPTGFDAIPFAPAFSASPALLTQIQTTNSTENGVPTFIGTATRSLDENGFELSVDRLEAGLGPLSSEEEICYLAVERNGCQQLDFSSLGGPATPVAFNAVHGGNVDGHGNNCTSGEGASFANGCFSSAPIAVASSRTRNGGDGHVLRRCSVSASEIILTADEDQISNNERNHIDELVSALAFGSTFTTPVTLSQASVSRFGRKTLFEWQTSAESFHLGFHLWGLVDDEWIQLNRRLIAGNGEAYSGIRDYRHTVRLPQDQDSIEQFGISTVDTGGFEEFYGPFSIDQEYGELAINEAVNWSQVRSERDAKLQKLGLVEINGRWRKATPRRVSGQNQKQFAAQRSVLNLSSLEDGLQMLSGSEILAAMPDWRGRRLDKLAVTLNGVAQPRHIISDDATLSSDDKIVFVVQAPQQQSAIYLSQLNYQIRFDQSRAVAAQTFDGTPASTEIATHHGLITQTVTTVNAYSAFLTNGDPWFDTELFTTGNPISKVYSFSLPPATDLGAGGLVSITVFGGLDFPEAEPDHHFQVRVNGLKVGDFVFDGASLFERSIVIEPEVLQHGENTITVTVPADTGHSADIILIDQIEVQSAQRLESGNSDRFQVSATSKDIRVAGFSDPSLVFAWRHDGGLTRIENVQQQDSEIVFSTLPYNDSTFYSVGELPVWNAAMPAHVSVAELKHEFEADLLVVAHPALISDELLAYLEHKRSQGLQVELVDWLDLVGSYGFGNDTPAALDTFLKLQAQHTQLTAGKPLDSVLLVGGHSWDYLNIDGSESVNFIPTHYRPVGIFGHAPTDNVFADLNGDNLPELSIGRWPARSQQDLQQIIAKSLAWEEKASSEQYQDALLITQNPDGRGLDFDQQMLGRVDTPLRQAGYLGTSTLVSMQDILDANEEDPVSFARQQIRDQINNGTDLVSFAGHASTSAWSFQGIVNTEFIQNLENFDDPILVMPLACYTTYYESPSINTLAHQWLFAGKQGAAAIHGASVLGEYRENAVFAKRFIDASKTHKTLGAAIRAAKQAMSSDNAMLHNWALLGDPTLPLH